MRNKKIGTWIATLLITMLTFAGLGQTMVHAVEVEGPLTDVIITKLESSAEAEDIVPGDDHDYDEPFAGVLPGTPLNGVSFTWYQVDEELFNEMVADPGEYATEDDIPEDITGNVTEKTSGAGQVTVSGLGEGFYWFIENPKGTIVSSTAVPFGLALPFTNKAGSGYLEQIYVYPKNVLTDDEPDIEKTVDESNVAIGQLNTWTVSLDIPEGIEDYDKFSFYDIIDSRLDFVGIESVMASSITLIDGTDYNANYVKPRLDFVFTEAGLIKLANATSETVDIKIETRVNNTAIMGQEIPNNATLEFNNGHGEDKEKTPETPPTVHTGGRAFVKKDGEKGTLLEGAEFKIQNAAGAFVNVATNGKITFGGNGTTFTSANGGSFEVRGLPYGDYVLVEIKAPQGYALPTNRETPFEVDATSYHSDPTEIGIGTDQVPDVIKTINNRRLVIPQTGGIGTALFTVVGAVMMLLSAIFYKRTKEA